MSQARLPYGRQEIAAEDLAAVEACLRSERITQGPRVREFEAGLEQVSGAPHAVAVSSGTAALHLLYQALGVQAGDVVVTSPITFVATANAARYLGAEVVFSDVEPDTGLLDPVDLERTLARLAQARRQPRLVVPVDFAGQPADLPRIADLAAQAGAQVVSDAAHSLGASYEHAGRTVQAGSCTHSVGAIFSFHPVKHITTGEGGAALTRDPEVRDRLLALRTHGVHRDAERLVRPRDDVWAGPWYYEQDQLGYNYRLTDLQSALGCAQLARLDDFLARRRRLAARYDAALAAAPFAGRLAVLGLRPQRRSSYHLYVLRVLPAPGEAARDVAARRRDLFLHLQRAGIDPQVHYIPVPWQPFHRDDAPLPGAEAYYAGCLSLPLYPSLSDADQRRVLEALADWVG